MVAKHAKKEIRIVNIVVSTALEKDIPLEKMAATLPNTEYNPEQFPGLVLRVKKPKSAVLVFSSGNLVCTGTKSIAQVKEVVDQVIKQLAKIGVRITTKPKITVTAQRKYIKICAALVINLMFFFADRFSINLVEGLSS